jgi:hypothetical protein
MVMNVRTFLREYSTFKAKARKGETVRVKDKEGGFLFSSVIYQVSMDGGRSWPVNEQVIQRGAEFSSAHPLPGVCGGKNCVMIGDLALVPVVLADGMLLLPVILSPLGPDETYFNPVGGYTYTDAELLRGRWRDG